jgi:hypothetical protein
MVQLSKFLSPVAIENSFLALETQLLLTTFDNDQLYQLNPLASSPQLELVAAKFAVTGGVRGNRMYANETI